ncbi:MAG: hypothetical protein K0R46_1076 [Herbinix sp.]|nr:hypothetical protein [Herbinix sp.]
MTTYIALLRGINVGGKNIIKMALLKQVFETIGLLEVNTYIQSGNVLFKSEEAEDLLQKRIEQEIEKAFGFAVNVVLRTSSELEHIIMNCPFSEEEVSAAEASSDSESLYVSLLTLAPPQGKVEALSLYKSEDELYKIIGREVYLLFHQSIRDSKLANKLQKLDASATVRNWKTLSKLLELSKAMDT